MKRDCRTDSFNGCAINEETQLMASLENAEVAETDHVGVCNEEAPSPVSGIGALHQINASTLERFNVSSS